MNIQDAAREFLDDILPSNASITQRDEMFKAFMAGFTAATGFFSGQITAMEEDQAMAAIEDVHRQLETFVGGLPILDTVAFGCGGSD